MAAMIASRPPIFMAFALVRPSFSFNKFLFFAAPFTMPLIALTASLGFLASFINFSRVLLPLTSFSILPLSIPLTLSANFAGFLASSTISPIFLAQAAAFSFIPPTIELIFLLNDFPRSSAH